MPKFCFPTNPLLDAAQQIASIRKAGFDLIELGLEAPEGLPEKILKEKGRIKKILRKYDTCVHVVHTAWWMEFGSHYEGVRKAWLAEARKAVDVAHAFGAGKVNFHSHARGMTTKSPKHKKELLKLFSQSMKEIIAYAKPFGIKIMLENTAGRGEIKEFSDFKWLVDKTPGLYVHLDVGHAFVMGGMKEIERYLKAFSRKTLYVHIHDNHGKEDEHLGIGEGSIDFRETVRLLKKYGYKEPLGLEVFSGSIGNAAKSLRKLKGLWAE